MRLAVSDEKLDPNLSNAPNFGKSAAAPSSVCGPAVTSLVLPTLTGFSNPPTGRRASRPGRRLDEKPGALGGIAADAEKYSAVRMIPCI